MSYPNLEVRSCINSILPLIFGIPRQVVKTYSSSWHNAPAITYLIIPTQLANVATKTTV